MNKLLQLFLKFSGFFVFIVLELICFALIIQYNDAQNRIFFGTTNTFVGITLEKKQSIQKYFYLSETIKGLQKANAALDSKLSSILYNSASTVDTFKTEDLVYTFIPASITAKNILGTKNYFTIDKGTIDSVELHMGVISDKGVIGIITGVSKHNAKVMTIFHPQSSISAALKRNHYFGSLSWNDLDYQRVNLNGIPKYVDLIEGDTIITSGYSNLFPKGKMIGIIETFTDHKEKNDYAITIKLDEDLLNLQSVYVVNNLMKEEIEQMQNNSNE